MTQKFFLLFVLGSCATHVPSHSPESHSHLYALPYGPRQKVKIYQAWHGSFSHQGSHEYAVDFLLSKKDPVLASRGGVVVEAVDTFAKGGNDKSLLNKANFVEILHEDGTRAEYYHLYPKSLRVKKGELVKAAQLLALSGDTGYATVPHLHFMVFTRDPHSRIKKSIPVFFKTSESEKTILKVGKSYFQP